jgi:hypothetical protein
MPHRCPKTEAQATRLVARTRRTIERCLAGKVNCDTTTRRHLSDALKIARVAEGAARDSQRVDQCDYARRKLNRAQEMYREAHSLISLDKFMKKLKKRD